MASITCISLMFLAFTCFINLSNAAYCSSTGNFTPDSTYAKNRDIILSSFASNVTAHNGFFTTTIGQAEDQVYGLVFCNPNPNAENCSRKVRDAIQELKDSCPYQKEALSFANYTYVVRYANRPFFGVLESSNQEAGYNTGKITSNLEQFDSNWTTLMERVVSKASEGNSTFKYATGEEDFFFQTIYTEMMCTPDLSVSYCRECLRTVVSRYRSCCWGYRGGYVRNSNCHFRWDLYRFYTPVPGAVATALPPPPQPSPPITANFSPPTTSPIPTKKSDTINSRTIVVVIVVPSATVIAVGLLSFAIFYRKKMKLEDKKNVGRRIEEAENLQFSFAKIQLATNNFSDNNKLGQGGFGSVYKGVLPDGQVIAVKRLSQNSGQGENEFKNEVLFLARQQHRNLVRLRGFCLGGDERLLIYEFLPNSSLDRFIFDANKRKLLNWDIRKKIIAGIARGVNYLHEDSQVRIIHRDLKASNILLDQDMNPKISDFGMAKLVGVDRTQETASRIVGTFGYMAPEYAFQGHVSVKSDVFSFGVLVLEIITGEKISSFNRGEEYQDLLTYVWKNWKKGTALAVIDPTLLRAKSKGDIISIIHIALLCVQENVANRPTMASVLLMISSNSITLPKPSGPAYVVHSTTTEGTTQVTRNGSKFTVRRESQDSPVNISQNEASITELDPR